MKIVAVDDATSKWVVRQLGHIAVFQALTILERTTVLGEAELVTANVSEIIVKEGETTQEFYVLLSGEATLMVTLPGDYGAGCRTFASGRDHWRTGCALK